jgi:hypothetical protein
MIGREVEQEDASGKRFGKSTLRIDFWPTDFHSPCGFCRRTRYHLMKSQCWFPVNREMA